MGKDSVFADSTDYDGVAFQAGGFSIKTPVTQDFEDFGLTWPF